MIRTVSVKDRVEFAKTNKADMFISVHVDAYAKNETQQKTGISVLIDKNNNNILLASALINELKKSYTTEDKIRAREIGIWVLDANVCPAALIECGYLTNTKDEAFITNNSNQEKIAKNILTAIENFAANQNDRQSAVAVMDTTPNIFYKNKKVNRLEVNQSKVKVTYDDGSKETITKAEAERRGFDFPPPPPPPFRRLHRLPHCLQHKAIHQPHPLRRHLLLQPALPKNALYVIDGKIIPLAEVKTINQRDFESINVLKGASAVAKYGEKGKNGVIEITKKKDHVENIVINSSNETNAANPVYFLDGKEIVKR